MINRLQFDYTNAAGFFSDEEWSASRAKVVNATEVLFSRTGKGNDFLGWIDLPHAAEGEAERIAGIAAEIRAECDALIVIGIGGSYMGAKAVVDACRPTFGKGSPEILYAGQHIDGEYLEGLLSSIEEKRVAVNVISKSGTTTEPALAFRVIKQWMERRYGKADASRRIIATTDEHRGALRALAVREGYRTFTIPDSVGGRFSVFTPVGLFPIACAGISPQGLLEGAKSMMPRCGEKDVTTNPALAYAAVRQAAYAQGRIIEILASFFPKLSSIAEWWKQLFGESEGKDGKGIFPASVQNSTDLHSLGQYIQDGERKLFETFLMIDHPQAAITVPEQEDDADALNYLAGTSMHDINEKAYAGTAAAHSIGGVPNSTIRIPDASPESIGGLLYFFEIAVALSGYALGVNPFDQPGVEAYKTNMFALLNKPGFETQRELLLSQSNSKQPFTVK